MARLNKKEYEILKDLGSEWEWITRDREDKGKRLYVWDVKPRKNDGDWEIAWYEIGDWMLIEESYLFQFIQWLDGGPTNIQELIDEYEEGVIECGDCSRDMEGDERVCAYCGWERFPENKETEVKKDIEWAKNQIDLRDTGTTDMDDPQFYVNEGLRIALDFLNQLDE